MGRNTSIFLGDHFEGFVASQVASGRYSSTSEVIRAGLRLMEEREQKLIALRRALVEGEKSGPAREFSMKRVKTNARRKGSRSNT
jgi:antitoxin ParD1/3/4